MQTVSVLIGCLCLIIALFRVIERLLQVFQVLQEMFLLCIYLLLRTVLLLDEIYHLSEQHQDVLFELHAHISGKRSLVGTPT